MRSGIRAFYTRNSRSRFGHPAGCLGPDHERVYVSIVFLWLANQAWEWHSASGLVMLSRSIRIASRTELPVITECR